MEQKFFETEFLNKKIPVYYIKDRTDALTALENLSKYDCMFGLDIETAAYPEYAHVPFAALNTYYSQPRLIQIYNQKSVVVIDLFYAPVWEALIEFLSCKRLIAHFAVFEMSFLTKMGAPKLDLHCSLLMAKTLFHATRPTDGGLSVGLEALVKGLFGVDLPKEQQVSDWSVPELTFQQIEYAALDAVATFEVGEKLAEFIQRYNLTRYYRLIKDVQYPIVRMQLNGLGFDAEGHAEMADVWGQQLYLARKNLLRFTGLSKITAHTMGDFLEGSLDRQTLDVWPRTGTGRLATDANAFIEFSNLKIVKPFSEFKKLEKLVTAFGDKLLHNVNIVTKRIHPQYRISGARTGRLSCSQPNLQQVPRGKLLRSSFVVPEGRTLLCADYSQIEIRVGAELSRDKKMLEAYRKGGDLHRLTAAVVSGKPISQVDDQDRQMAKCINFGLMFGLGARNFSHYAKKSYGVDITSEKASEAVETFRETYEGYREWQLEQTEIAKKTFRTWTPCGKIRKLSSENLWGTPMNNPVQGGAAECMEHAMIRLQDRIDEVFPKNTVLPVITVHDELGVECDLKYQEDATEILKDSMVKGFQDVFPRGITNKLVEVKSGATWAECKGYK